MRRRAWRLLGQEFSLVLALALCGLAVLQSVMDRPWWKIGVSLGLALALLVCGWMVRRQMQRSAHD